MDPGSPLRSARDDGEGAEGFGAPPWPHLQAPSSRRRGSMQRGSGSIRAPA